MNYIKDFSLEDSRICFYVDNIGMLGLVSNPITGNYEIDGFVFQTHENKAYIIESRGIRPSITKRKIDAVVFTDTQYRNMYNAIKELINDTDHRIKNLDGGYAGYYKTINLSPSNILGNVNLGVRLEGNHGREKPIYQSRVHEFDKIVFDIVMNKHDITPQQKWMTQEEHKIQDLMWNLFPTSL